jgi:ferredoxin-thioredoxin reductase catalytic chain
MNTPLITEAAIDSTYAQIKKETEEGGYRLNPDGEFTRNLIRGLMKNEQRYGYRSCPCRLASGKRAEDLDIICPCDYRDPDLDQYGACYCALYVSEAIAGGAKLAAPVPERRPPRSERQMKQAVRTVPAVPQNPAAVLPYPVWRCKVCGYLCARDEPPGICPVCKAQKDRFERFM